MSINRVIINYIINYSKSTHHGTVMTKDLGSPGISSPSYETFGILQEGGHRSFFDWRQSFLIIDLSTINPSYIT